MPPGIDLDLHVHYGFVWLTDPDVIADDLSAARRGQQNGILGGALPGVLAMMTGLHTGTVPFRVELWDNVPPLAENWEEAVELSFEAAGTELLLHAFEDSHLLVIPAPGNYRARYCASGMDQAREQDTRMPDDPVTDRYLLALWPAQPAGETVLRQTSEIAAYWAQAAAGLA